MQCATHPNVETELACSRCGKAICPRCLVHTPVGARCRECANIRRIPTYNLGRATYARAIGAAIVIGVVTGAVWWFFNSIAFGLGIFFALFVGLGLGYVIGEGVAVATNRRAGPPLQIIAVGGVALAYLVRVALLVSVEGWGLVEFRFYEGLPLIAVALAGYIAAQRLR